MNDVEIPEFLTALGVLAREGWGWFVAGWDATVAPLLASAPAWTIGLLVVSAIVWVVSKR